MDSGTDRDVAGASPRPAVPSGGSRFEAAFRMSPDAITMTRLSDGLYLDVNDGFTAMTGWPREEAIGRTSLGMGIWKHPEDRGRFASQVLLDGRAANQEFEFLARDGRTVVGLMSGSIMEDGGEAVMLTVTRDITDRHRAEEELHASQEDLRATVRDALGLLGMVVELRDPYTQGHQERVANLAVQIAGEMGIGEAETDLLATAARLHDIGKLKVPAEILSKPGRLEDEEWPLVRKHVEYGYRILRQARFSHPLAELVYMHHERLDGSGYPRGLRGGQVPPLARILAVADVLEAMASHRPYRAALGKEAALDELRSNPGLYDSEVAAACQRLEDRGVLDL